MKRLEFVLLLLIGFVFAGCEKEEKPVTPASTTAISVGLGSDYANMVYFDLFSGEQVLTVLHADWDLNISNDPTQHLIYLNSSNYPFAKNAGVVAFESVTDTAGPNKWRYDYPSGEAQKAALQGLFNTDGSTTGQVFILDRGVYSDGTSRGYYKIRGEESTSASISFRLGSLDGAVDTVITLLKDVDYRTLTFDIDDLDKGSFEPLSNDWHMSFTQYTDYDLTVEGDTVAYLVRGALINVQQVTAVRYEGSKSFDQLTKEDALLEEFSTDLNVIGYDWKYFDFDTGTYITDETISYFVREKSGNYYKMRFVGFYNDLGEKGYPMFELKGL